MSVFKVSEVEISYTYKCSPSQLPHVRGSKDIYAILKENWANDLDFRERFYVIMLNRNNKVLGISNVSTGGCDKTYVDLKIIFQLCLKANAQAFVIAHNHPSGSLKPSDSDMHLTKTISKVANLLEMPLLDHIIVTSENYYSFNDNGNLL